MAAERSAASLREKPLSLASSAAFSSAGRSGEVMFALEMADGSATYKTVVLRESGGPSTPRLFGSIIDVSGILVWGRSRVIGVGHFNDLLVRRKPASPCRDLK